MPGCKRSDVLYRRFYTGDSGILEPHSGWRFATVLIVLSPSRRRQVERLVYNVDNGIVFAFGFGGEGGGGKGLLSASLVGLLNVEQSFKARASN